MRRHFHKRPWENALFRFVSRYAARTDGGGVNLHTAPIFASRTPQTHKRVLTRAKNEKFELERELKSQVEASRSSAAGGVGAAISARVADERNWVLGKDLSEEEEVVNADLVRDGKVKVLGTWKSFKVFKPYTNGGCEYDGIGHSVGSHMENG